MQIYHSFYLLFIKFLLIFSAHKITTFPPLLQLFSQEKFSTTSTPYTIHFTLAAMLPIKPPFTQKKRTSILRRFS